MANCRRIIRPVIQSGVLSIFSNLLNRWQQRFDLCCRYCNGWLHSCVSCLYIVYRFTMSASYFILMCVIFCFTMGQQRTCWGQSVLSTIESLMLCAIQIDVEKCGVALLGQKVQPRLWSSLPATMAQQFLLSHLHTTSSVLVLYWFIMRLPKL